MPGNTEMLLEVIGFSVLLAIARSTHYAAGPPALKRPIDLTRRKMVIKMTKKVLTRSFSGNLDLRIHGNL
jgi:hypothetical protein